MKSKSRGHVTGHTEVGVLKGDDGSERYKNRGVQSITKHDLIT